MEDMVLGTVGVVAIICTIGLPVLLGLVACYMNIKSRHAERMALIEKGISPFDTSRRGQKGPNSYPALRNGMFMAGLAIGLLAGLFIHPLIPDTSSWSELAVPVVALLFGGIAFILYFFISRKMYEKEQRQNPSRDW